MKNQFFNTLRELFDSSTEQFSDNLAFSYVGEEGYTYREIGKKTREVASLLAQYGAKKGDKVALLAQNMPNWPVAYFATLGFGMVSVPLLPDFSSFEISNILEHSESKILFVSERLNYKIEEQWRERLDLIINIDNFEILHAKEGLTPGELTTPEEEELATIIYTSGTTGSSKGVMLTHYNLSKHLLSAHLLRPGYEWDIWLSLLPLSHTLECSLGMLLPMVSGSSVYYIKRAPTPSILMEALKTVRPTTLLSVPMIIEKIYRDTVLPQFTSKESLKRIYSTTVGRKLLHLVAGKKLKESFGGRLRFFGIGGAKLDTEVERFLLEARFPYAIGYGLTETAPLIAGATPSMVKLQSTGPTVHGVELKIDNANSETGEGEILVKGPNVMQGYYKNPEATAEAFTEDGWFRTNDLGTVDKKGRLFIKGRLNNMILGPSGENIYPEEIEEVLNGHSMVAESLVTESEGKLIARIHLNPDKVKTLKEASDEALAIYYQQKDKLMAAYDEKKEEFLAAYDEKKEELMAAYDEKREELMAAFEEKIEHIKEEIFHYVNARVNRFSKIAVVIDHPHQFEKTATHKIKRYKYMNLD